MKTLTQFNTPPQKDSIICLSILYNEEDFIDFFIDYYSKMGVTHFIFIDNNSEDNSQKRLKYLSEDFNIRILFTQESYKQTISGSKWINEILKEFKDKWIFIADLDEYVLFRDNKTLLDLKNSMEASGTNVAQFTLIDFYPIGKKEGIYDFGIDPFVNSKFYDKAIDNNDYFLDKTKDGSLVIKGGFRHRLSEKKKAKGNTYCLNKRSFFKFNFGDTHKISGGTHWIHPYEFVRWNTFKKWEKYSNIIKYDPEMNIIAHFKFAKRDFVSFVQNRVKRNQDFNNSKEYKGYLNKGVSSFYHKDKTCKFISNNELYSNTIDLLF
tara:strand:- start:941 stop:1906 length:966 start_codon:yes stop_codon:yes gene_type:complete